MIYKFGPVLPSTKNFFQNRKLDAKTGNPAQRYSRSFIGIECWWFLWMKGNHANTTIIQEQPAHQISTKLWNLTFDQPGRDLRVLALLVSMFPSWRQRTVLKVKTITSSFNLLFLKLRQCSISFARFWPQLAPTEVSPNKISYNGCFLRHRL